jgi:nitrite reductase (NO-forming)
MNIINITIGILSFAALVACGSNEKDYIEVKGKEFSTVQDLEEEVNNKSSLELEKSKDKEEVATDTQLTNIDVDLMTKGKEIYALCLACHQDNGKGLPGAFPPLAQSDYMLEDVNRTIKTILNGSSSAITVNGIKYPGNTMTKFNNLSDEDVAAVTSYVLNSWGNLGGLVTADMVASNR